MNTPLPPDLDRFVREEVESGRFADAGEVVTEALRRLRDARAAEAKKLATLRALIDEGLADLAAGRYSTRTAEDILSDFKRRHGISS